MAMLILPSIISSSSKSGSIAKSFPSFRKINVTRTGI
jgi:hypothetical protein